MAADDNQILYSASQEGIAYASAAILYDECVKQHVIKDDGRDAQEWLEKYIEKIRAVADKGDPTQAAMSIKVADAMQIGFDTVNGHFNTILKTDNLLPMPSIVRPPNTHGPISQKEQALIDRLV